MLDIAVIIFIALMTFLGYKKGFIKTLMQFASYFLSLIIAWIIYPHITKFLETTPLANTIYEAVMKNYISPNTPQITAGAFGLPGVFDNMITSSVNPAVSNITESVAAGVTSLILSIISIILVFILSKIIISVLTNILNIFAKLPIISQFNRLGGLIIGFLQGILLTYIVFALIAVFIPLNSSDQMHNMISQSSISNQMYNNNAILNLFVKQ